MRRAGRSPVEWGRAIALLATAAVTVSCHDGGSVPDRLSTYDLFVGALVEQRPAPDVIGYEINVALFSDFAEKLRFVQLPPGASASYRGEEVFDFPVGTRLVKTFYFSSDRRTANARRRLIETRLLIHERDGWVGYPYVWNESQTEARLRITGARVPVEWIDERGAPQRLEYRVPSAADCGLCHRTDGRTMAPIATKGPQLNRAEADGTEPTNQLLRWQRRGLLAGLPPIEQVSRYPSADDATSGTLEDRARAYLDVNCAHCHNPVGPASGAQLDLRYAQREPRRFGVFKRPVAAGRGSGDLLYDIWPGRPEASILLYRMESVEPGVMMPELGRTLVDRAGTDIVRKWVIELDRRGAHPGQLARAARATRGCGPTREPRCGRRAHAVPADATASARSTRPCSS